MSHTFIGSEGKCSVLALAYGRDSKGKLSYVLYTVAVPVAFVSRWLALAIYAAVAAIWFLPDTRLEKRGARG